MSQATNGPTQNGQRRWLGRLVLGIVGVLGVLFVIFYATIAFGVVDGEEFSPDTFERRSFIYYEIPLIGQQITPIGRDDTTNPLESYLCTQKLVPVNKSTKPRWDLVYARRSTVEVFRGDAAIFCAYLDAEDKEGNLYWKTWTEEHPKLAKILWPAVARVANQQLYIFAPEMLELAKTANDPQSLSRELDRTLARKYLHLGAMQQELGQHETAVELLTEALNYAPNDDDLKQRRAESQRILDRDDEAEVDEAQPKG
jgi:hypothetical protein